MTVVDDFRQFLATRRRVLFQHAWVALAVTAMALAAYTGVAYGNSWGNDDWDHVYRSCQLRGTEIADRPLALGILYLACPFFGGNPHYYYLALLGLRALSAFLLYLLVWQISPTQPLFAFACAAASTTLLVSDSFYLNTLLQQTDHILSHLVTLLALNFYAAYMRSKAIWRYRLPVLAMSVLLAGAAPLVREATFPLLFSVPIFLLIFERDWSRPRLAGMAVWNVVILAGAIRFVWAIRRPNNYSAATFLDLNMVRMAFDSLKQFGYSFSEPFKVLVTTVYEFKAAVIIAVLVATFSFWIVSRVSRPAQTALRGPKHYWFFGAWTLSGIAATWLGFAAFLPTAYAATLDHTHVLSTSGEAVALMGGVWLMSGLAVNERGKMAVQLGGLAWITLMGAVLVNVEQQEMYRYAATWENSAFFWRSLANLIPDVKEPTLLILIENPAIQETPLVSGFSFQYGSRYFYNDQSTGIIPSDTIFGGWEASDAGIWYWEQWIETAHLFNWNEVIFITRDNDGQVRILDRLPDPFLTLYRQSLYQPYNRILKGFIPPRIQRAFPILAEPVWSGQTYLLRNPP